jgi:ESF2/ABP1 family protein
MPERKKIMCMRRTFQNCLKSDIRREPAMDRFTKTENSDSEEEEQTFHTLGSDEEFFGGANALNSDEEIEVEEEQQTKSKSTKKSFDDAFDNDSGSDEDEGVSTEKKPFTEDDENLNELHRKSKLLKFKESKKPKGKTGVVYISKIPPYMKPTKMRQILVRFGEVDRLFLKKEDQIRHKQRVKGGGNKKTSYEEGWAEFIRKKDAKVCADTLNGNILGGKKGSFYHDDIMNVKYLSGFKWSDLTAQISKENETRQSRLQMEISQAKKLNKTFIENIERSKMIENIQKGKPKKKNDDQIRRTFEQRSVKTTRADGKDRYKESNSKKLDSVLSKVF